MMLNILIQIDSNKSNLINDILGDHVLNNDLKASSVAKVAILKIDEI